MLAVRMNGEPLPIEHGFPVRMVVPGLYGYVSATKWVTELELTTFDAFDPYWIQRGWAEQAPIKTQSRIDTPRSNASRSRRVTWSSPGSPGRSTEASNASRSGSTTARGSRPSSPTQDTIDTWRQWRYDVDARRRPVTTPSRSVPPTPTARPRRRIRVEPFPDGATGYHQVRVTVICPAPLDSRHGRTAGGRDHGVAIGLGHHEARHGDAGGARRPLRDARRVRASHARPAVRVRVGCSRSRGCR